jgi:hypothetical protein
MMRHCRSLRLILYCPSWQKNTSFCFIISYYIVLLCRFFFFFFFFHILVAFYILIKKEEERKKNTKYKVVDVNVHCEGVFSIYWGAIWCTFVWCVYLNHVEYSLSRFRYNTLYL